MKKGQVYKIAGKSYKLYNIMENTQLAMFAKLGKKGQLLKCNALNMMTLTFEQFNEYTKLGSIEAA